MKYNIFLSTGSRHKNIFALNRKQLNRLVEAFKNGKTQISISGTYYYLGRTQKLFIFTFNSDRNLDETKELFEQHSMFSKDSLGHYVDPRKLSIFGKEITSEILSNAGFDITKIYTASIDSFVNPRKIYSLKELKSDKFDFSILIKMCRELNNNYSNSNYLSVFLLLKAICDHIPQIYNMHSFSQVSDYYQNSRSNKISLRNLLSLAEIDSNALISSYDKFIGNDLISMSQDLEALLEKIIVRNTSKDS